MAFFGNKFVNVVIYAVTTITLFVAMGSNLFDWILKNSNH